MYVVTFYFRGGQHRQTLGYKTKESVDLQIESYRKTIEEHSSNNFMMKDDYGHIIFSNMMDITAFVVTEMQGEWEFNCEMKMLEVKAQARLQQRAQNDPSLKLVQSVNH